MPGRTVTNGYGTKHKAERARWAARVKAGGVDCARCGHPITPDQPFDLDHTDDRTGYNGPAHVACNRRAGGIKGNKSAKRTPTPQRRRWKL